MAKASSNENALKHTWQCTEKEGVNTAHECRIAIIGIGRAGNNTVSRLMESGTSAAECIAINTDSAHLEASTAHLKILIGKRLTKGRGVNGNPKLGRAAIEESKKRIEALLSDINIVFITAGLGGGTGTGAAPVVAEIARKKGITTIGVITMPLQVRNSPTRDATTSLADMKRVCDTVVVIDNDKLRQLAPQLPENEVFKAADQIIANMIKGIVELISSPSLVNLNLTEFKTIISRGGIAAIGIGESDAPDRAEEATRIALRTPLSGTGYAGATGALIHVAGDNNLTVAEANRVGEMVTETIHGNSNVIWGAKVNPAQEGKLKVTVVMTGVTSHRTLSGLGTIAPQLFDLEEFAEPDTTPEITLNLYQMESILK